MVGKNCGKRTPYPLYAHCIYISGLTPCIYSNASDDMSKSKNNATPEVMILNFIQGHHSFEASKQLGQLRK